jgi:glycosyltransferase involved in cell wall biosynthesis
MPRVSVIIATYNRSDALRCAIATVQLQTFLDWELIVVGDACTDDTAEVVAGFRDPCIRFVNRKKNFGEQSAPHNDGFRMANGSLIAYLNHDDLWFPNHLESLVRFLDETRADLVYALRFSLGQDGLIFCGMTNAELRYDPSHLVESSLWLVRRELIEELNGWRGAISINARTPSQDFLTRAWQRGKDIRCHPRVTAIMLHAGTRPNSFKLRDSRQHEELLAGISDPNLRERLITDGLIQSTRRTHELSLQLMSWPERLNHRIDRVLLAFGLRPDSVRNRLARRPKGWFVDHIRQVGGLPPIERDRKGR